MGIKTRSVLIIGTVLAVTGAWAQSVDTVDGEVTVPPLAERQYSEQRQPCDNYQAQRQPFFGDTHVHTRYSLDASTQGTRTTPDQAYRFARGEQIGIQPWDKNGVAARSLQLERPLDFSTVSDHAGLMGEVYICNTPGVEGYGSWGCIGYRHLPRVAYYLYNFMASTQGKHLSWCGDNGELCKEGALGPWQEMQQAAEAHYDRSEGCEFTSFVAYEWTGVDNDTLGNLHRNVLFRNAEVPRLPTSAIDNPDVEYLWDSLTANCENGGAGMANCDALTIPHNSNISAGKMFELTMADGSPLTKEYAAKRAKYEPLVEVMQHKGSSECYFARDGSADELCAFEQLPVNSFKNYGELTGPQPDDGYLRTVLVEGMKQQQRLGVNPFKWGIVASTDTHLGTPGAANEAKFLGHGGAGVPAGKKIPPGLPDLLEYNPGGLAVVWAEENSRDSLFDAMQRKETYGTSGPRIVSRFFGGWGYDDNLCGSANFVEQGYAGGVAMGGDLPAMSADSTAPVFAVFAQQDAGTPQGPGNALQRIQIIKGWVDGEGEKHERVYDVAGNPNNGASVDLDSCQTQGEGYASLCKVWRDPDFDKAEHAYYYSRTVENPSCRWSQRICAVNKVDCSLPSTIGEGLEGCCSDSHRPVIQERAWSSPIWYQPAG